MTEFKQQWRKIISVCLNALASEHKLVIEPISETSIITETPPQPELGDIAFPMFPYARLFRTAPSRIADSLSSRIAAGTEYLKFGKPSPHGPYLNIRLNRSYIFDQVIRAVLAAKESYGCTTRLKKSRAMIEFSCPNTNKPLHLGHLRNDALGESVARILKANGADIRKVNLINDRGIHICKSMLAYKRFGNGKTPESEGIKPDHFVGDYYILFDKWVKQEPDADRQVREMLKDWENGVGEVTELWQTMNAWAVSGIEETYRKTGISFDMVYYESKTYRLGKEAVLQGLANNVFYQDSDGSVWVDLKEIKLDKKVLLRNDGTSLYLTQDIGTAITRYKDWPFDRLIYVVASEQQYHFKVLFYILEKLGFEWARHLHHLSYGMVNLPEGKMKSREGAVVDADDLLEELKAMAMEEIRSKGRELIVGDIEKISEAIALGALNYYLLQVSPYKDMIFKPEESISFNGNTGPYLQY
ncbi:MAG: arginine--tRNA ligase, partial [Spirochaetota bacterium]